MKGFNNAEIYVDGVGIINTSITFFEGRIHSVGHPCDEPIPLPKGAIVVPGFIDQHVHGAGGADAMDGDDDALKKMSQTLLKEGTTAFLPTTMTQTKERIIKALKCVNRLIGRRFDLGATILGAHLEGPFISPFFAGAQPRDCISPPNEILFEEFYKASGGNIKIVTLAPEREGAKDLIKRALQLGVRVSVGHTAAKYREAEEAFSLGATSVTHTFNAQTGLHHRDVGTVGAAMLFDGAYTELIADKIHLSPEAIKLLLKNKPKDKIILITDSLRNKHLPDGLSELGGQSVTVRNGEARLADGTLAGSVLKMNEAVRNMIDLGVSFTDAVDFATKNPSTHLGIFDDYGSIKPGKRADITVLSPSGEVLMTLVAGRPLYTAL